MTRFWANHALFLESLVGQKNKSDMPLQPPHYEALPIEHMFFVIMAHINQPPSASESTATFVFHFEHCFQSL